MAQQNFAKYLPTPHGGKPLATLSQRAVYALWRADLIRHLETIAKITSARATGSWRFRFASCSLAESFPQGTPQWELKMRRACVFNELKNEKLEFPTSPLSSPVAAFLTPQGSS